MRTTVYLVRHGEINNYRKEYYGKTLDLCLSEKGKSQLRRLGQGLKKSNIKLEKIYSSPLKRAVESAKILVKAFNASIPIEIKRGLIDVNIPFLVGKPLKLRQEIHKKGLDEYDDDFVKKGNESREKIVNRMRRAFDDIIRKNKGKTVVLVSHGDPLRCLLFNLIHPGKKIPPIPRMPKSEYVNKGQAFNLIVTDKGQIKVVGSKH